MMQSTVEAIAERIRAFAKFVWCVLRIFFLIATFSVIFCVIFIIFDFGQRGMISVLCGLVLFNLIILVLIGTEK